MSGAIFVLMIPVAWVFLSVIFNTCIDTYNFVAESELIDGYSKWDKIWIMPSHIPKFFLRRFLENLSLELAGFRRVRRW